jgi:hypothetical protein
MNDTETRQLTEELKREGQILSDTLEAVLRKVGLLRVHLIRLGTIGCQKRGRYVRAIICGDPHPRFNPEYAPAVSLCRECKGKLQGYLPSGIDPSWIDRLDTMTPRVILFEGEDPE